ncbi:NO-inducible flavohemoprotein [Kurthia sibirica]|uniref:Flavohemoprotein n=1 Tax=Kurthia sibirica TaxID=202750 RepID=A0A2U3ANQ2_9BACL|nr:NO-inducible flavohemoprotein [Kurthia sibirica]PWI26168.1 NO-inducible flavohemoprotein [Kurthia sibirica]GEK33428.1 flavohemoprotein [Kurthia sibirica]
MLSQQSMNIVKSTAPILEVHGVTITKTFYKNLFEAHPALLNIFNHANQEKGRQQTALANTVYAAAVHIEKLEAIIPVVKQIAQKHRSLGVLPEHYPIVGEFLLRAIKEVLGDAATDDIIAAWGEAYGVIADVFIAEEQLLYEEAEQQEGGFKGFKDFTIIDRQQENDEIVSFYLQPSDDSKLAAYLPGQYITVQVKIPNEQYTMNRQYSLSKSFDGKSYRISVKRDNKNTPAGKVSNLLHDHLQIGDQLALSAPAGWFTFETTDKPVTFIAGGIGVTPFISMFKNAVDNSSSATVKLIHSVNNATDQLFVQDLSIIAASSEQSTYTSKLTAQDGQIDRTYLAQQVNINGIVYVCGPVGFMQMINKELVALGMTAENIRYEFFGPAMNI